ncbi:RloB domain-containing protein [Corynebacterium diphtheriae]
MFEKAQSLRDNYDRIILVMDTDSHAHLSSVLQRCAKDSKIDAVVTSPMFELWLLWHVEDCARQLDKTVLEKLLKARKLWMENGERACTPLFLWISTVMQLQELNVLGQILPAINQLQTLGRRCLGYWNSWMPRRNEKLCSGSC